VVSMAERFLRRIVLCSNSTDTPLTAGYPKTCLPFVIAAFKGLFQLSIAAVQPFSDPLTPRHIFTLCFNDQSTGGACRRLRRFAILSASSPAWRARRDAEHG